MNDTREKIVIVEADTADRDALRTLMEDGGYDVSAFPTAHEGLDAVRHAEADLLLLNAGLPAAGAYTAHEAVAAIRGSAVTRRVRVILLVGSGAEDRAAGLDLGARRPPDVAISILAEIVATLAAAEAKALQ